MNPRRRRRRRGLVENEEQGKNKKMKSIVVEELEQEEGIEGESETRFVDLDQDTLHNVLKRVDAVSLLRAAGVNKLWRKVARDWRLCEPFAIRYFASCGKHKYIYLFRKFSLSWNIHLVILHNIAKPEPSDFNSIDPQVFSRQIGPWR